MKLLQSFQSLPSCRRKLLFVLLWVNTCPLAMESASESPSGCCCRSVGNMSRIQASEGAFFHHHWTKHWIYIFLQQPSMTCMKYLSSTTLKAKSVIQWYIMQPEILALVRNLEMVCTYIKFSKFWLQSTPDISSPCSASQSCSWCFLGTRWICAQVPSWYQDTAHQTYYILDWPKHNLWCFRCN